MKTLAEVLKCFGGTDSPQVQIDGIPEGHAFHRTGTPHYGAFYEKDNKVFQVWTKELSKEELLEKYNKREGKEI